MVSLNITAEGQVQINQIRFSMLKVGYFYCLIFMHKILCKIEQDNNCSRFFKLNPSYLLVTQCLFTFAFHHNRKEQIMHQI